MKDIETLKQEKIYEIKKAGIVAVFEEASSQIKDFLNFLSGFQKSEKMSE